jgi:hypothetical protein
MTARNWRQDMPTPQAYWMNKVLYDIHHKPDELERYRRDPAAYVAAVPLEPALQAAIGNDDIGAMYLNGVSPYLLRAHCLGMRIPEDVFLSSLRALAEVAHG